MRMPPALHAQLLVLCLAAAFGCDKETEESKPATHADGGSSPNAGVDRNIAEAVAAVANGEATAQQGPPDTGVFGPGAADKEMRAGAFPKLSAGTKGSGPTVHFSSVPSKAARTVQLEVSVQTGPRSALPTLDFGVRLQPSEDKPAVPPGPLELLGKVSVAKLGADQPGELPPGLDKQVAKARGTELDFQLAPDGAGRLVSVVPSKDLDESFKQVLRSGVDALALAFLPYPAEPVGVGAYWMVTSREPFAGLDVVVYRMMKLSKIDGDTATIDVSAKRFVAGGDIGFPGLPPHQLVEFTGNATGEIEVRASDPSSVHGEVADILRATIVPRDNQPGQPPGQKLSVQIAIRTQLAVTR